MLRSGKGRSVSHWEFGSLFWVRSRQFLTSKIVSVQHQESPLLKWLESYCNYKSYICRETYHLLRKEVRLNFHQLHPQKAAIQVTKKYGNFLCFSRCLEATSQKRHVNFRRLPLPLALLEPRVAGGARISGQTLGGRMLRPERPESRARQYRKSDVVKKSGDAVAGRGDFIFWSKKNGVGFLPSILEHGCFPGSWQKKLPSFFLGGDIKE